MASTNKRNKEKNARSYHGFALKQSTFRMKRMHYFNSSQRQKNNSQDLDM